MVKADLGQLKGVFLMKFVSDFLLFLDPFTRFQELIREHVSYYYS